MDDELSAKEKALLEKYSGKGRKRWRKKAANRIAAQFAGDYTEERDPMPEDGPGKSDREPRPEPDREAGERE